MIVVYGGHLNFLEPILDRLAEIGYPSIKDTFQNPEFEEADTIWFEWADNNVANFTKEYAKQLDEKNVIVRLHAVEAYTGWFHNINWNVVNHLVVVSNHIKEKIKEHIPSNVIIHHIPNAIDVDKWTFKERDHGKNIAIVGHFQTDKGALFVPHIMAMLPDYEFHIVGTVRLSPHNRDGEYFYHLLDDLCLNNRITFHPHQNDLNKWYEDNDINYILVPSMAESFNVVIGEAMAKGIMPIISNFKGAKGIWIGHFVYNSLNEIPMILEAPYKSKDYRKYVETYYSLDVVTNKIKKII